MPSLCKHHLDTADAKRPKHHLDTSRKPPKPQAKKLFHGTFGIHINNLWSHRAHAQPMQTPSGHCRCKKTQTPSRHEPKTAQTASQKTVSRYLWNPHKTIFGATEHKPSLCKHKPMQTPSGHCRCKKTQQKDPNIISTRAENRPPRTSPLEQSKTATEHNLWSHRAHAQPMQTPCRHCRCKKTQTPCPNSQNVQTSRRAPPLRGGRRIYIHTDHWWSFVRQKQLSQSYASESRLSRLSRRLSQGNRKPCWNCMSLLGPFQVKQDFKRLMDPGNFWVDWGLSLQHEANGKSAAWLSGVLASESIVERYGGAPCQLPKRELPWTYHQSCNPFLRQPVQREQALLQGKEGMFQLKALLVQRLFGRDFEPGLYSTVVGRN